MNMTDLYLTTGIKRDVCNSKLSRSDIVFQKLKKYEEKYSKKKILTTNESALFDTTQDINNLVDSDQIITYAKATENELSLQGNLKHAHTLGAHAKCDNGVKPTIKYSSAGVISLDISKNTRSSIYGSTGYTEKVNQARFRDLRDENSSSSEKIAEINDSPYLTDENINSILSYNNCKQRNNVKYHSVLSQGGTTEVGQRENNTMSKTVSMKNVSHMSQHSYIPQVNQSEHLQSGRDELSSELESIKTETGTSCSQGLSQDISNVVNSKTAVEAENKNSFVNDIASSSNESQTFLTENEQHISSSIQKSQIGIGSKSDEKKLLCIKCNRILKENNSCKAETMGKIANKAIQTDRANMLHSPNDPQTPFKTSAERSNLHLQELSLYEYIFPSNSDKGISKNDPVSNMLNRMLLAQVNLTQHFISSQYTMYQAHCVSVQNLSNNYQPVTLENTNKFIKQSKKIKRSRGIFS